MRRPLLRESANEYRRRWQAVHDADIQEIRQTPLEVKLRQLSVLVGSASLFPEQPDLSPQESEVLHRWNRLRIHYGNPSSRRN